jgi:hypothetical protein
MNNSWLRFFGNKFVVAALALALLCFGAWLYFFIREAEKKNSMDAMHAIPADAAFALRVNDLNKLARKLASEAELPRLIRSEASAGKVCHSLLYITDTLASRSTALADLSQQPLWISAHVFGQEVAFLFSLNLPDNLYISDVKQLTEELALAGYGMDELQYDDETIYSFRRGSVDVFHAAVARRVLLASRSRVLVEMAIRQAKAPASLADEQAFVDAASTAGANEDANLYLSHRKLPQLLGIYLHAGYSRQLNFMENLGSFTVLDLSLRQDAVQLSGFLFADNADKSYISVLGSQSTQRFSSFDILPRATDGALCLGVSNGQRLTSAYATFREQWQPTGSAKRRSNLALLNAKLGKEPAQLFEELHPVELAVAHVPMSGLAEANTWFVVLKSDDPIAALQNLNNQIKQVAQAEDKPESSYVLTEKMSNHEPLTLYRNPARGFMGALHGELFAQCEDAYVAVLGSYFIFASSASAAKEFVLEALLHKTLAQTAELSEQLSSAAHAMLYLNPSKPNALATSVLADAPQKTAQKAAQKVPKKSPVTEAIHCVAAQLEAMSGKMYCNMLFKTASHEGDRQPVNGMNATFELKLDAPLRAAPWVVKNHRNQQQELLAQDANNTIYLIDNQGLILWKRSLGEPIVERVLQVDYLRNDKLQLLFNTKTKLHLIDRLGRNVGKFPIALSSPATAPVAVFDYDKSRDYRYFVPCENGHIYAYEANGKPLSGFSPEHPFGAIAQPLQHLRVKDKDYVVLADQHRAYILDRKGNERVRLRESVAPARHSTLAPDYGEDGRIARLVTTTANGRRAYLYFDGEVERAELTPKPDDDHFFVAMNRGNQPSFAVADGKNLSVYDANFNLRFSYTFKHPQALPPQQFQPLPSVALYGVFVEEEQKAYLLDRNGRLCAGFPLSAVAPVLAVNLYDSKDQYCIVVGDSNGFLSCYEN